MSADQNKLVVEPDLKTAFDLLKKNIMLSLNCHAIGTVELFNPVTQTVNVSVNYKKTFITSDPILGDIAKTVDYPILVDCPVIILGGGPAQITFPIQVGDTCLILFNDRDMSRWFEDGSTGPIPSQRFHSLADGVALIGLNSLASSILDYDQSRAALSYGETVVAVGLTQVKIANALQTLGGVLDGMVNLIETLSNVITPTTGLDPTAHTAFVATCEAYKVIIGGLLE